MLLSDALPVANTGNANDLAGSRGTLNLLLASACVLALGGVNLLVSIASGMGPKYIVVPLWSDQPSGVTR